MISIPNKHTVSSNCVSINLRTSLNYSRCNDTFHSVKQNNFILSESYHAVSPLRIKINFSTALYRRNRKMLSNIKTSECFIFMRSDGGLLLFPRKIRFYSYTRVNKSNFPLRKTQLQKLREKSFSCNI